jgi:hypothetical protein
MLDVSSRVQMANKLGISWAVCDIALGNNPPYNL